MAARSRGDDTGAPAADELHGTWIAHGVVKRAIPEFNQPVGTRLERSWTFYNRCNATRCQLYLERETGGRTEWAPAYEEEDGRLSSVSEQLAAGCGSPEPSRLTRSFSITKKGDDELEAVEGEYGTSTGCPATPIDGRLQWTVEKTSDECPSHPGCRDALASQ
jgi:hypothetical protein